MKIEKNILVVISNIFFLSPLLFIPESASIVEETVIYFVSIGLTLTSGIFHWYEYKWPGSINRPNGGVTESWKASIGYFWQKADMVFIYLLFSSTLGYLVDAAFFGFLIGVVISIMYLKSYFDYNTIGLLVLLNVVAISGINLEFALGILFIFALAYKVRKESGVNPLRHSWWHMLSGIAIGLIVAAKNYNLYL